MPHTWLENTPSIWNIPKLARRSSHPPCTFLYWYCLLVVMTTQHHQQNVLQYCYHRVYRLPEKAEYQVCNATIWLDRIIALSSDIATIHEEDKNNGNRTYQINNKLYRHKYSSNNNNINNNSHQACKTFKQFLLHKTNMVPTPLLWWVNLKRSSIKIHNPRCWYFHNFLDFWISWKYVWTRITSHTAVWTKNWVWKNV